MSEPVRHLVEKSWTPQMTEEVYKFADSMTSDPERRAAIVGMIHIIWPRLIDAYAVDFQAEQSS